jgi:hypothetical protein
LPSSSAHQALALTSSSRYAPKIRTKNYPHFTTGFGIRSDRYSFEIRAMARAAASPDHLDPAIYIGRREGIPVVTGTNCSPGTGAREFLASFKQAKAI